MHPKLAVPVPLLSSEGSRSPPGGVREKVPGPMAPWPSDGYVPERPLPKMAAETAANKKKPLNPPNSMIGQFTAVSGTAFMG